MRNRYGLVGVALLLWTIVGIALIGFGSYFVLGYSPIANAIAFGACFGAVIGLVVGVIGASPIVSTNAISVFRWGVLGSVIGAIVGVFALLGIGGFPRRAPADLSLVLLGPISIAVGAAVGLLSGVVLSRQRRSN